MSNKPINEIKRNQLPSKEQNKTADNLPLDNKTRNLAVIKKKTLWDRATYDRLVLIADIMGFKDCVFKNTHAELTTKLRDFLKTLYRRMSPFTSGGNHHMKIAIFSDSIAIACDSAAKENWNKIIRAATVLMYLAKEQDFAIKGCIAKGNFTFDQDNDRQLFFGKAGIHAFLQQEEMFYYGISIHHSAEEDVRSNKIPDSLSHAIKYTKLPFKTGHSRHYNLAWHLVRTEREPLGKDAYIEWLEKCEEKESNPHVRAYIINTIEVVNNH